MFKRMDLHLLMTFKDNQIMSVALMIAEEKILAMSRINLLPVFQRQFDRRKWRMRMKFIAEAVLLKEVKDPGNSIVFHYLLRLLA
jgi:hypothetical protein